ncbi:MAG TPA: lysophospholipid acyltransferase family protein [Acidisarcina sp.]
MSQPHKHGERGVVPISRLLLAFFRIYARWYVARHFTAMRVAHAERCRPVPDTESALPSPLIVCVNHASWWDPLIGLLVSEFLFPGAELYVPMDAAALAHYGLFKRLGAFPVEMGTLRGASQFLRSSREVLKREHAVLWITPQGAFTDVRTRPMTLQPGLAALAKRTPGATIIPMAFEYTFWNERLPEILINIGEPLVVSEHGEAPDLQVAMTHALEELAILGIARDPAAFHTLLSGRSGVGGVYGWWQRLRDSLRARTVRRESVRR